MTDAMLNAILKRAGAEQEGGKAKLQDGRSLTLYASHEGVSLSAGRIVETQLDGELLYARNKKGEEFVLALGDVFAASIAGSSEVDGGRKAGFLG